MSIELDDVGIVAEDLTAAIAFFEVLGLELEGCAMVEDEWAGRVTGLRPARGDRDAPLSRRHGRLELSSFLEPDVGPTTGWRRSTRLVTCA